MVLVKLNDYSKETSAGNAEGHTNCIGEGFVDGFEFGEGHGRNSGDYYGHGFGDSWGGSSGEGRGNNFYFT